MSEGVADSGLQHERTALAWDRTGLSFLVAGAFLLRAGGPTFSAVRHAPAAIALALGALLLVVAARRYGTQRAAFDRRRNPASPRLVRAVGVGASVVSAAALVLALTA
jgi:uncharacterized membrane protein YidH (DUF202 family)